MTNHAKKKKQLKKERLILAHGYRGFSSWLVGSIMDGPMVGQRVMVKSDGGAELSTPCQPEEETRSMNMNTCLG